MTLMMTKSPAPMARAFSNNSRPTSPGESDCAANPEPTTTTINITQPMNSPAIARHSTPRTPAEVFTPVTADAPVCALGSSSSSMLMRNYGQ